MRKFFYILFALVVFCTITITSCNFYLNNEEFLNYCESIHHEIDERDEIYKKDQIISIPSTNKTIKAHYCSVFSLNINYINQHYAIGLGNQSGYVRDLKIELAYSQNAASFKSYDIDYPQVFSTTSSTIYIRIINTTDRDITLNKLIATSWIDNEAVNAPLSTTLSYIEEKECRYIQEIIMNKTISGWVSSNYLYLPTAANYTISCTSSNSITIKLDYVRHENESWDSFSGDNGDLNKVYSSNSPETFNTISPPSGYVSSPIRIEFFPYSETITVYKLIIEADRPFSPASIKLLHDL